MSVQDARTPLHVSVEKGDIATTQCLIAAGASITAKARKLNNATPLDLAAKSPCRAILEHHASVFATLTADPAALVSTAFVHCAALSTSEEPAPAMSLSLSAYQLEPSFRWPQPAARAKVVAWARDAFILQLASSTEPFAVLPDDCAGDVLEYLEMTITRTESLQYVSYRILSRLRHRHGCVQ